MKKDKAKGKQTIKCDVTNCSYNDCECKACSLEKIKVCNCSSDKTKEATICDSFKEKK